MMKRLLSTGRASVDPKIESVLRGAWNDLDPSASVMLEKLHGSTAPMIWHKHGSFLDHLRDVWVMLSVWNQPQHWCRLGLFHSAYSNSFVSMNLYDINKDREKLASLIGEDSESLVYKFCVYNRQQVEDQVSEELMVRATSTKHIHDGSTVELSATEAAACVTETVADMMDQSFAWQSELEKGHTKSLWPGIYAPTLRMTKISRFAYGLRQSGVVPENLLPPVFNRCSTILDPDREKLARDLYWRIVGHVDGHGGHAGGAGEPEIRTLLEASVLNPFVGEPHVIRAQILLQQGRWEDAEHAAKTGLDILCQWATQWDKRMPFNAWVNWTRCLIFQAKLREWPDTWGGLESLGAIDSTMRFRGLNKDRLG